LSLEHGLTHLCRALVEGIAFRLKSLQEILTEVGVEIRQITASGGFTQSDFWLQVVTDALNREVVVPHWGETSCRGAAFWAMLAAGKGKGLEALADFAKPGRSCSPNRTDAAVYDRVYPLHIKLYQALKDNFDDVARLQRELHQGLENGRLRP
jgi:gluconokinase